MKRFFIISLFFAVSGYLVAQQNLTLYNMDRVVQSKFVNPVSNHTYKVSLGGLLIPLTGQVSPPFHFNYANNSWMYNDIFHMGTGTKADSLVFDLDRMMENVHKGNHFRFETDLELLTIGINTKTMFLSFSINEKFRYGVSLPGDFMHFLAYGNRKFFDDDKPMDFKAFNVNFTHYHEFAAGITAMANDKIRIGGRLKLLFGGMNVSTQINKFSVYTDPESIYMTASTDMVINSSLPLPIEYKYYEDGDSIKLEFPDDIGDYVSPVSYLVNPRNFGFGFDLGFNYDINSKFSAFLSATDIGLITWNTNPLSLTSKGEFLFKGLEVKFWNDSLTMEQSLQDMLDSVVRTFHFEGNNFGYITMLPTNVYLGGTYKFHDKLHFGLFYRAEFYNKNLLSSITLSANSNLTKWFSAHLSYTIANNNLGGLGLGFSLRTAIFQFYFVTDNLTGMILPQKSRNFNFRFGTNLVFGYKEKTQSSTFY